jgi:8-oxo-dGTP pyrophosphatase MutT (NUDIX family)
VSVWKPAVTVAAVIENEGRFLFVEEEADGRRVLNQPAGHLDPGESLLAAVAREVLEETAHRFVPQALVGVYRWHNRSTGVTFLRFAFRGIANGREEGRALDPEILALHWLTPQELAARRAMHRTPLVERCLADSLAGKSYPLELLSREFA